MLSPSEYITVPRVHTDTLLRHLPRVAYNEFGEVMALLTGEAVVPELEAGEGERAESSSHRSILHLYLEESCYG